MNEILQSTGPVILKFTAEWCGPCKSYSPILQQVAHELNIKIIDVDVEIKPDIAAQYRVRSVPTTVVLNDGEAIATYVGTGSVAQIKKLVQELLP